MTPEVATTVSAVPLMALATLPALRNAIYGSRSEATCAWLLERYVPGWRPIVGETVQIGIGTKRIDFRVNGAFIEYHPIAHEREFACSSAWRDTKRIMLQLRPHGRRELMHALSQELRAQYYKRRRLLIDSSHFRDLELILACDITEFYRAVLKRFAHDLPREKIVVKEWEQRREELRRGQQR